MATELNRVQAARFWAKVNKEAPGGCWEWTASRTAYGYGRFALRSERLLKAHRVAWEILRGPIPQDMTLDHLCPETRAASIRIISRS